VEGIHHLSDDATRTARWAEIEPFQDPDCAYAFISQGQVLADATGLEGARQLLLDWFEPWESVQFESERFSPVGDKVVVLIRQRGRMAESQNEVEALVAAIYFLKEGRVVRVEWYLDRSEALEAAGLSE
jgi:ketosteroid isomerase-like protein